MSSCPKDRIGITGDSLCIVMECFSRKAAASTEDGEIEAEVEGPATDVEGVSAGAVCFAFFSFLDFFSFLESEGASAVGFD